MTTREVLLEPRNVESLDCAPNKGVLGRALRKDAQIIKKRMDYMNEKVGSELQTKIEKRLQ